MRNVAKGLRSALNKRYVSALCSALVWCLLLQTSPVLAQETAQTRPSIFDSSAAVEAGYTVDRLTNNSPSWNSQYFKAFIPLKANGLVNVQFDTVERFGLRDQMVSATYAYPLTFGVIAFDGSYSDNPHFLAKNSVGLGWNGKLPAGFGYTLGFTQRDYSEALLNIYTLGVEKNAGQFRIAYTGSIATLDSSRGEFAGRAQAQWISPGDNRLGVTYSQGLEPTVIDVGNLSTIQNQYIQADGLCWFTKHVGLTAAYWHSKEGNYYQRNGGQLGLRIKL